MDMKIFDAGAVVLDSGRTHRGTHLAYQTYGTLNADTSNAIVFPTPYGGHHTDIEWMIGSDHALDPDQDNHCRKNMRLQFHVVCRKEGA